MQTSPLRVIWLVSWVTLVALPAAAQTTPLTTRDAEGKIVIQRQQAGTSLGAYLGDAGSRRGAKVGKVLNDSSAARAGLTENDLIIGLGTDRIENAAQVFQWLNLRKPNETVPVRIRRNDAELTLNVTLSERRAKGDDPCQKLLSETNAMLAEAERRKTLAEEATRKGDKKAAEENAAEAEALFKQAETSRLHVEQALIEGRTGTIGRKDTCLPSDGGAETVGLGLDVTALTPQLASFFGLKPAQGLLVTDVFSGTPAEKAGFKAGDCLVSLNDKTIANAFELRRIFEDASEPTLSANVVRDGQALTLSVKRR